MATHIFLEFSSRSLGKWSNLTKIHVKWVGSTTNLVGFPISIFSCQQKDQGFRAEDELKNSCPLQEKSIVLAPRYKWYILPIGWSVIIYHLPVIKGTRNSYWQVSSYFWGLKNTHSYIVRFWLNTLGHLDFFGGGVISVSIPFFWVNSEKTWGTLQHDPYYI